MWTVHLGSKGGVATQKKFVCVLHCFFCVFVIVPPFPSVLNSALQSISCVSDVQGISCVTAVHGISCVSVVLCVSCLSPSSNSPSLHFHICLALGLLGSAPHFLLFSILESALQCSVSLLISALFHYVPYPRKPPLATIVSIAHQRWLHRMWQVAQTHTRFIS